MYGQHAWVEEGHDPIDGQRAVDSHVMGSNIAGDVSTYDISQSHEVSTDVPFSAFDLSIHKV